MKSIYSFLFVIFILSACCTISCSHPKPEPEVFDRAEAMMETAPDSALTLLSTFDTDSLSGAAQRARYALLMSMALDKNGIDTARFDIIKPAIDYYLDHGTPDEILRTRYYQGRIFQNAGLRDSALQCFTKAIATAPQIHDSLCLARAFVAQARMFYYFHDLNGYRESYAEAADIYNKYSLSDYELDCLINALNGCILMNDRYQADSLITLCKSIKTDNDSYIQRLEGRYLAYAIQFGNKDDIQNWVDNHGSNLKINAFNALNIALAYNKLGDNNTALEILNYIKNSKLSYDTIKYESVIVNVLKDLGKYEDAFSVYWNYSHRQDSINAVKFDQKSRAIKEKHEIELQAQIDANHKSQIIWWCTVGIIVLTMGIFLLLFIVRSNKSKKILALEKVKAKELENDKLKSDSMRLLLEKDQLSLKAENLALQVEKLENESDNLKTIIDAHEELPNEVQDIIRERIEMLNSLLASYISTNEKYEKPYDQWIKKLTDNTESFMNSGRLAFMVSHSNFIRYFEERGLTIDEINYICLYAIGLNGKEVGNYMKKPGHVNQSSIIRKKLGMDKHDTNLGNYVRNLLKNL